MDGNFPPFAALSQETRESYLTNSRIASLFPLLVHEPKIREKKNEKIEDFKEELKRLKMNYDKYFSEIKFTENNNLLLYCKTAEAYSYVLNLRKFMDGSIKELDKASEEKCIVIRGTNFEELNDEVFESIKDENCLVKKEEMKSVKANIKVNIVKVYCKNTAVAEKLCKEGIIIDYIRHKCSKFIRKPKITVCFNCGSTDHISRACKNESICIICSDKGHTKSNCIHKGKEDIAKHYKCPNCHFDHPATYGGCKVLKEKLKSLHEYSTTNTAKNRDLFLSII